MLDSPHAPPTETSVWTGAAYLDLAAPDPHALPPLSVIARALSRNARWSGLPIEFYSGAEHSVSVSRFARSLAQRYNEDRPNSDSVDPEAAARAGLLHDVPEFILGDLATPAKRLCPDYCALHDSVLLAVLARFLPDLSDCSPGVYAVTWGCVEIADAHAAGIEKATLYPDAPDFMAGTIRADLPGDLFRSPDPAAAFLAEAARLGVA